MRRTILLFSLLLLVLSGCAVQDHQKIAPRKDSVPSLTKEQQEKLLRKREEEEQRRREKMNQDVLDSMTILIPAII